MKKNKTMKLLTAFIFVAIMALLSVLGYSFGMRLFAAEGTEAFPGTDISVVIESDMSKSDVGNMLKEEGLIKDSRIFVIQCIIYESEFYEGEYILNTSSSPEQIIEQLKVSNEEEE